MKFGSSRGCREDGERIGMPFGSTAVPEHSNQISKVHAALEAALLTSGNPLKRKSVRRERFAEFWKSECVDSDVFPLGLLLESREGRLSANVQRLSDEQQHP